MSWWKRPKCATCKKVLKRKHPTGILMVETGEGRMDLVVCDDCSRFWEGSVNVLNKNLGGKDV